MRIDFTAQAEKQYSKQPVLVQKKARKKFHLLLDNFRHPSLQIKKMAGSNRYEGRIDIHYRFTFILIQDSIIILSIGMHDTGLGKK